MNTPRSSGDQNNDTTNMAASSLNVLHHRQAPRHHNTQLTQSMVFPSKVSLIDNTLAQGTH
eukprot:scaffold2619_cov162-Skeletonema_marinoi.AAC.2